MPRVPVIHADFSTLVRCAKRPLPELPAWHYKVRCVELQHDLWHGACKLEAEMRLWRARSETGYGQRWYRARGQYTFEVREIES